LVRGGVVLQEDDRKGRQLEFGKGGMDRLEFNLSLHLGEGPCYSSSFVPWNFYMIEVDNDFFNF